MIITTKQANVASPRNKTTLPLFIGTPVLKLPVTETARNFYLCMAACSVDLAITIAAKLASNWSGANGVQEDCMDKMVHRKMVHRKMVRGSVLSIIEAIGTAAIGGLLAA
jgi:hypothetical protein